MTSDQVAAALEELLGSPRAEPVTVDHLVAAGTEVAKRADAGHRKYHSAAYLGAIIVTELRVRGLSWREIDKKTGIEATTGRRWFKRFAEGTLGPEPGDRS
jgi:hypothetical protein